ncbi:MAG: STAS domain-containing protein [Kiritimatiellae bacterium]|nr:STAS domain-containing protein [Kiritimatiellia bacterium]
MFEFTIPTRLDAVNAPEVEQELLRKVAAEKAENVICDFSDTVYISSAGLRVMLVLSKEMKKLGGKCTLRNMNDDIYAIFKMAGFHTIIDIEK